MKSLLVLLALGLPFARVHAAANQQPAIAAPVPAWTTDYNQALARAAAEHKCVLLDFTGSDWCIWCHRLDREILSQAPFLNYARDHLVLVEVDFPENKPQSDALKAQNKRLGDTFKITGYPTVVLLDEHGHELGRTGYMQGGPKTFVRELQWLNAKPTPNVNR